MIYLVQNKAQDYCDLVEIDDPGNVFVFYFEVANVLETALRYTQQSEIQH